MGFDGPKILDSSEREFGLTAPVFRVWDYNKGTPPEEALHYATFDNANNSPHLDEYDWLVIEEAPTTVCNTGKRYPHPQGVQLMARVSFTIRHPDHKFNLHAPPGASAEFTELDWKKLKNYALSPELYDIEFYAHGPVTGAKQTTHIVEVVDWSRGRAENMTVSNCSIAVQGRHITTAAEVAM